MIKFDEIELQIIDEYVNKRLSIREISWLHSGYGRTKISNILDKYANSSEENAIKLALRKASQKMHKEVTSLDEVSSEDLTEEQIELAYKQIVEERKSLTKVSEVLRKNRETVRKAIIDFLDGDKIAIKEFEKILRDNQNFNQEKDFFENLSEAEKKKCIYKRLNIRRTFSGRNTYPYEMLDRKYNRLINYFEKRNSEVLDSDARISKDDLLRMMFDFPTMLSMSLSDKIKPVVEALDYKHLGFEDSSRVLKHNPAILGSSIQRTALQIRILKDFGTLEFALKKPRAFRTSPEFMYSLIKLWEKKGREGELFLTTRRLESYNIDPKNLMSEFDVREEYGDDEYFDER